MKIFKNKWTMYACILLVLILGNVSGLVVTSQTDFYKVIKLPFFAPSGRVFAPVWTFLYILIGYTLYKLISDEKHFSHVNNILFTSGIAINLLWSYVFFSQENFGFALIMLIWMWLITLYFIVWVSRKINIILYTQLPYFFWLTFAGGLNLAVMLLN